MYKIQNTVFALLLTLLPAGLPTVSAQESENTPAIPPARVAVAGLVHDHVIGLLYGHANRDDLKIVGVAESNPSLLSQMAKDHALPEAIQFNDVVTMLDTVKPQGVFVFTRTIDHPKVVKECAKRGIHVMVEKPFAVNLAAAREMEKAALDGGIHLMVNYQSSWFSCHHEVNKVLNETGELGQPKKIVYLHGHPGPVELGCSEPFLDWLFDPAQSGGGTLIDTGCYGANLVSWWMKGQRPLSVTAVTQKLKSGNRPELEDEATIILQYPETFVTILASWNWGKERSDVEIYGTTGNVANYMDNKIRLQTGDMMRPKIKAATPLPKQANNPYTYFGAVIAGVEKPSGPSALEYNMIATEILDAARQSAKTGKKVTLK